MPDEHLLPAELMPAPVDVQALEQFLEAAAADPMLIDRILGHASIQEGDADLIGFEVESLQHAEWAMRHLAEANARQRTIDQQAVEWAHQVEVWHQAETARVAARARYFEGLLVQYMHERRAADDRVKTVRMPSGSIESTARKARPTITDEAVLVEWARTNRPDVVEERTIYRVPAAALARLGAVVEIEEPGSAGEKISRTVFAATGEDDGPVEVPGVDVVPARTDVRVKPTDA